MRQSRVPKAGMGLFALRRFRAGERIAVYTGHVIDPVADGAGAQGAYWEEVTREARRDGGDGAAADYVMRAGRVWIDGNRNGSVAKYINDARGTRWENNAKMCEGGQWGRAAASETAASPGSSADEGRPR